MLVEKKKRWKKKCNVQLEEQNGEHCVPLEIIAESMEFRVMERGTIHCIVKDLIPRQRLLTFYKKTQDS